MRIEEEIKKIIAVVNEKLDKTFSPKGKKIFLVLVCTAIVALIFLIISSAVGSHKKAEDPEMAAPEAITEPIGEMTEVDVNIENPDESMVTLSVEDYGRANPFLPSSESFSDVMKYGIELMAPPEQVTEEESEAVKVMTTKISGIMYDNKNPSAILNIEGSDYLVHSGDRINNYRILSIGKEIVTVQLGSNVYKARVGEIVTDGTINHNNVYNLQNRFGGSKR